MGKLRRMFLKYVGQEVHRTPDSVQPNQPRLLRYFGTALCQFLLFSAASYQCPRSRPNFIAFEYYFLNKSCH